MAPSTVAETPPPRPAPMHLAILGTRGIPAAYSGFETLAEELGARLVERGHRVTVYGRPRYVPAGYRSHRGVSLVTLPTISHKYLDTVVHTGLSVLHALTRRYDAILVCNAANAIFTALPRLVGTKVALNVDGHDRHRKKWGAVGRWWYAMSERMALGFPNAIVTDAEVIRDYYLRAHGAATVLIPYGAEAERVPDRDVIDSFGLEPDRYILYVSRLEPENNAHAVIAGFEQVSTPMKLAIVGDAPYAPEYIARLKQTRDPRVVFTGGIYGRGYRQLQSRAYAYVQATEVGGTHPALVEAMAYGHAVVANDVPEHREVLADAGMYFEAGRPETLAAVLEKLLAEPSLVERLGQRAAARARAQYSWSAVTDAYEQLFASLVRPVTVLS
jgi:glycosyltransferase involved in cell wall biosynthesis